jgi:Pilin (bacterial filament)
MAQTVVPHDFQPGTPARAAEVNEDFDTLGLAIDGNAAVLADKRGLIGLTPEAAQIQVAFDLTAALRWNIADFRADTGTFPVDNGQVYGESPYSWSNRFVDSAWILNGGRVDIIFNADTAPGIANGVVTLTPNDPGSGTVWFDCAGDAATAAYVAELDCAFSDPPNEDLYSAWRQVHTAMDLLANSGVQDKVQVYHKAYSTWPRDNAQAGLFPADTYRNKYVVRLAVSGDGTNESTVSVTFGGDHCHAGLCGKALNWTPEDVGDAIRWTCSATPGGIASRLVPPICRD